MVYAIRASSCSAGEADERTSGDPGKGRISDEEILRSSVGKAQIVTYALQSVQPNFNNIGGV